MNASFSRSFDRLAFEDYESAVAGSVLFCVYKHCGYDGSSGRVPPCGSGSTPTPPSSVLSPTSRPPGWAEALSTAPDPESSSGSLSSPPRSAASPWEALTQRPHNVDLTITRSDEFNLQRHRKRLVSFDFHLPWNVWEIFWVGFFMYFSSSNVSTYLILYRASQEIWDLYY